jgi:hypothetical protein
MINFIKRLLGQPTTAMVHACCDDPAARRERALQLARANPSEVYTELVRMAEGQRRSWWRRYTYCDQLAAVEALGETGLSSALDYLRHLSSTEAKATITEAVYFQMGDNYLEGPCFVELPGQATSFPNARCTLKTKLAYSIKLQSVSGHSVWVHSNEDIRAQLQSIMSAPPHSILKTAILKLEGTSKLGGFGPATNM